MAVHDSAALLNQANILRAFLFEVDAFAAMVSKDTSTSLYRHERIREDHLLNIIVQRQVVRLQELKRLLYGL